MAERIDGFIPVPDRRHRHEVQVHAPAELVFEVAESFDLESIWLVHGLYWLRMKILRAKELPRRRAKGLLEEMRGIGWGVLAHDPGRLLIMGAATQPWVPDVKFTGIPADRFATFGEPGQVKIAWTVEAEPLGPALTRLGTETRVVATDAEARYKFRRYWRMFGAGIVLIRWLLLPAVRREAERRFEAAPRSHGEVRRQRAGPPTCPGR